MKKILLLGALVGLSLPASAATESVFTGTGFFVTNNGVAVTNAHVVDGCADIAVRMGGSEYRLAVRVAEDKRNDLALIRVQNIQTNTVPLALNMRPRLGEDAFVFGFPLGGLLSDGGNFTTGTVTSLAGLKNDSSTFQLSTPIQPGNSGGPVLDSNGNLIGVVVGKLNALAAVAAIKDIPQNVNFAIRSQTLDAFLQTQYITSAPLLRNQKLTGIEIAEIAQSSSLKVYCKKIDVQQNQQVASAPVDQPERPYWDHNGSKMQLQSVGIYRQFLYEVPRASIVDVGVKSGTILFSGKRQGNTYSGLAYIFSKNCGSTAFEVTGVVSEDQRQVTMYGKLPRKNDNCEIVGLGDITMLFTYHGQ